MIDTETKNMGEKYSIPHEAQKLFTEGILKNPLISKSLPLEALDYGAKVKYVGSDAPSIPINWRFAESISSLKGLEATLLNVLLSRKYGVEPQEVVINTDHAQLFIMSTLLWSINASEEEIAAGNSGPTATGMQRVTKYFPSWDIHKHQSTPHRSACTNIYRTRDNHFFHLHGSLNPNPSLDSIGLPHDSDASSAEEAWELYMKTMAAIDAGEMQRLASDVHKQAGTICWTLAEYAASEHGKANAHVGLFEIHSHPYANQAAGWWPDSTETSIRRPLGGLKVLDLTRIIAAPTMTRELAEMGASVMRVTAPHLADASMMHCDMNWGKWNCHLDFRKEEDRTKLKKLILDADIVVEGYRPGVLNKWGLGMEGVMDICKDRERGVIYVRENCYGWNGPWAYRSGWQQISDACCGVSMEFGRAMGNDEPVTPVFPNSDYCTGVAGVSGVLAALIQQGAYGGSYSVDVALNYYSQWLVQSCGAYPEKVWQDVWARNGRQVFRHYHNMSYTIPRHLEMLKANSKDTLFRDEFFESRAAKCIGKRVRTVKPVVQYPDGKVELGYNIGTRTNGLDQPRWPHDLMTEVIG